MSRQVVKLPRLQFTDVTYQALNGSFARWTSYKFLWRRRRKLRTGTKSAGCSSTSTTLPTKCRLQRALGARIWLETTGSEPSEFQLMVPFKSGRLSVSKDTATVIVVDDETSVRHALTEMLSVFGYNVEAYPSAEDLLQSLDPREIGCIVADVRMPGMDGIELVQELSRRDAANPVIVFSGHADIAMAVAAIKAGAEDFIEKPIDDSKLVAAINRGLARRFERQPRQETMQDLLARFDRLTPREVQVFDLVVEGHTSASIATLLKISPRTVESYRVPIMEKMGAASIAGLVRSAVRLGRLEP